MIPCKTFNCRLEKQSVDREVDPKVVDADPEEGGPLAGRGAALVVGEVVLEERGQGVARQLLKKPKSKTDGMYRRSNLVILNLVILNFFD